MSAKNLDKQNRWRNKTVAFRVSPEEDEQIEIAVRLSGLTKQEYITRRLMEREVVVQGNPRVYKALRDQLAAVLGELQRIESGAQVNGDLLDTITLIAKIMDGMKEAPNGRCKRKDCPESICWRRWRTVNPTYQHKYNRPAAGLQREIFRRRLQRIALENTTNERPG